MKTTPMLAVLLAGVCPLIAGPELRLTVQPQGKNLKLAWPSQSGESFRLESRTNLLTGDWSLLATNWPATAGAETSFTRTNAFTNTAAFYRVIRQPFAFDWSGTNFTYTDPERTFTGILLQPAGPGPFPGVIVNHGAGGTATGYSLTKARELSAWGMICIGPTLTHAAGGETNSYNVGDCPENLARLAACANVLASFARVDTNRLVMFGHSMGSFATIGGMALLTNRIRTAVISAGGVITDSAGTNNAAPTVTEALPVTSPFLMFHCDADPVVPPSRSLLFQQVLNSNSVPNQRILYSSNSIPNSNNWHNLHQDPAINADILTNTFQWFQAHGILP